MATTPNPHYPTPIDAVNTHCRICGSAVYCGGAQCPSSSLSLAYDQVPQNQETFISVAVWWPGISGGVRGPAAG